MEVIVTNSAKIGRNEVLSFVADNTSVDAAARLNQAIQEIIDGLADFPYKYQEEHTRRHGRVRRAVVKKGTLVFYKIDSDAQILYVLDIAPSRID